MGETSVQLPRWKSHKEVWGDKIVRVEDTPGGPIWHLACGALVNVSMLLERRAGDHPLGGYYVLYKDNFESWSPKEAFEEGYTRIE